MGREAISESVEEAESMVSKRLENMIHTVEEGESLI
jgi:hypothetical protein